MINFNCVFPKLHNGALNWFLHGTLQFVFEGSNYFTVGLFLPYAGERRPIIPSDNNCWCWCWLPFSSCPAISASGSKAGGQRGTNSRKQLIEQCNQCHKLPEPVLDRLTTSSSVYCCRILATVACCQPPVCYCPTGGTGCYFCSSITGFCWKTFSVCGQLTKGKLNRMEKSLYMRAWLKVNFDELNDML